MKYKAKPFRKKLLGYFMLFTVVIFSVLWLFQTVFLQSFYNSMIISNTKSAAEKIAAHASGGELTEYLDEISRNNSLLIFITDTEGEIIYSADEYKKGHKGFDGEPKHTKGGRGHKEENMPYRALPDSFGEFLQTLTASDSGEAEIKTEQMYYYGRYFDIGGERAVLYLGTTLNAVGSAARIIRIQLLIVTALSVAVGFVLAWFMSRSFSRPISQLNAKAHTLGENAEKHDFREGLLLGARRA